MREIIFRGKRVRDGEWVYGYLYITHTGTYEIGQYSEEYKIERMCSVVIPETVGQYTGLTDKNGKKIFEGDILAVGENGKSYQNVYVHYKNGAFRVSIFAIDILESRNTESEVIGNIYNNPELLKGGEEE